MAKQNRRLREQLDKERAVADRRHQETQRRLGVHDAALGVDTGDPELLTHDGGAPAGGSVSGAGSEWHYADSGNQVGPVDEDRMAQLWNQGVINRQTRVWRDGMSDWEELGGTVLFDRLTD